MPNFYIERLIVTGNCKEPSILEFKDGLNIVCGPSDSGKSYVLECIDYLFGSDKIRLDRITGYDLIKMIVSTENGKVTFERLLDTKRIRVSSTDRNIESGYYGISGKINNISDVWLQLIGINKEHYIIKNSRYERQRLTWRTFSHMFLIKETNVFQEQSIIMPKQNTSTTAALSALLFLMTGRDFAEAETLEEKKIKEARKRAVADYIHRRLSDFSVRKAELRAFPHQDAAYLQEKVEAVLNDIAINEKAISDAMRQNRQLLKEIFDLNAQLAECNTLYNRYQSLQSQYAADIQRLAFIVDGELNKEGLFVTSKCPFCENEITVQEEDGYVEASHAELHRIQLQLNDLIEAERDLIQERDEIEKKLSILNEKKLAVEKLINNELRPKVAMLKETLTEYRQAIEVQNEVSVISDFEITLQTELFDVLMDDEPEAEFKIKTYFDNQIIGVLNEYLTKILKLSRYENFSSAYFSPNTFDIIVNGKAKEAFGKGYRAFLNTVLAIALMEYLVKYGMYAPGFLIIDSPILSLKEVGDDQASDTMKSGLFQYMLNNQFNGQIIIIENNIPELDYSNANIIKFTKDPTKGRYGFLNDVR